MTGKPRESPYSWVTWLSKLLTGEQPCEWSVQFQSQYQGYDKVADSANLALWTINHASEVKKRAADLRSIGYTVTVEDQNKGVYRSKAGLAVGYKPDIVASSALSKKCVKIIDIKTGQPRNSDIVQVMLYLLMSGIEDGEVYYSKTGQTVPIGKEAADPSFIQNLNDTIARIVALEPALKTPGKNCRICPITAADCPERMENNGKPATEKV